MKNNTVYFTSNNGSLKRIIFNISNISKRYVLLTFMTIRLEKTEDIASDVSIVFVDCFGQAISTTMSCGHTCPPNHIICLFSANVINRSLSWVNALFDELFKITTLQNLKPEKNKNSGKFTKCLIFKAKL